MCEVIDREDASLEQVFVALLVKQIEALSEGTLGDVIACIREIAECKDAEERAEIMQGMREMLFPETIGRIIAGAVGSLDATDNLRGRACCVGSNIEVARRKAGWTQVELSEKSGVPQSHISRLEAGQHFPSARVLRRLAQALGVKVADLDLESADGIARGAASALRNVFDALERDRLTEVIPDPWAFALEGKRYAQSHLRR